MNVSLIPPRNAALMLGDGTVFSGYGIGKTGVSAGEICFTTGMTGYQETLTDPSFAGQIITFTFPHIGNVGANAEDIEGAFSRAAGLVIREPISDPSNFRSLSSLNQWLIAQGITGISGVDTRALTKHIRENGSQNAVIGFSSQSSVLSRQCMDEMKAALIAAPDMTGLELAASASVTQQSEWKQGRWKLGAGYSQPDNWQLTAGNSYHVVAIDFGQKHNIGRNLAELGCRITIVPATASADEILALKPDGVFLSNGPGDPAATGGYALATIRTLIEKNVPIFGICLGHQLLGLALGAKTVKMKQGHRGTNHPVKNLHTGKVEITSQNHGFAIADEGLPADLEVTHRSLFDGTIQGIRHTKKPAFSVQGHPESSPGPHDSRYLFTQFMESMAS